MRDPLFTPETIKRLETLKEYSDNNHEDTLVRILDEHELRLSQTEGNSERLSKKTTAKPPKIKKKKPKTSIIRLVKAGFLSENEKLTFVDYQGFSVGDYTIHVQKSKLFWNNTPYSMSRLAAVLLKKEGYESSSVRGPQFFRNEDGKTVLELWEKYLKQNV